MSYELIIQTEAIIDIQVDFEWYEKIRPGLGLELIQEIEICYYKISKNPQHYSYLTKNYRRIKTSRFPYLILYEIEGKKVSVSLSCL